MPLTGKEKSERQKRRRDEARTDAPPLESEALTDLPEAPAVSGEALKPQSEAPLSSTEARILEIQKELADPALVEKIEEAAGIMKDRAIRYERALSHHRWSTRPNATPMDLPEYKVPQRVSDGTWKGLGFCVECNESVSKGDNCCKGCFKAS